MNLYANHKYFFDKYEVNTSSRLTHFFAQIDHESGLVAKRESCYYTSIARLRAIFRTPFLGKPDSFVQKYLKNSVACANYVYANRMGNGDENSGDGFRYRGGGFLQNTGKNQYAKLSLKTGINFLAHPELIEKEENAMICALLFWHENKLNDLADKDNMIGITKKINGGINGLDDRKLKLVKYKSLFHGK